MAKQSTKSVQISPEIHEVLLSHSQKVGKKIRHLLERAILRCYGNGAEKA